MTKISHNLTILIVDDEPDALDLLSTLIKKFPGFTVYTALNFSDAKSISIGNLPDVIFTDIKMPEKNGFDLIDDYRRIGFDGPVIIVTAYEQYALKAIKKVAFDFLLKPIDVDDLQSILLKLTQYYSRKNSRLNKIKILTRTGFLIRDPMEVLYFQADGNYTMVYLIDLSTVISSINLGKIERQLPNESFFRISRSSIVNLHYLLEVERGGKSCKLQCNSIEVMLKITSDNIGKLEEII